MENTNQEQKGTKEDLLNSPEVKQKIEELAAAKVRAIEEQRSLESEKKSIEVEKIRLQEWQQRLENSTRSKQSEPKQETEKKQEVSSSDNPFAKLGLDEATATDMVKDYQNRQYQNRIDAFKAKMNAHVEDNKDSLGYLSKIDNEKAFAMIVTKMSAHKEATGQDLNISDAVSGVNEELEEMVSTFSPKQEASDNLDLRDNVSSDMVEADGNSEDSYKSISSASEDTGTEGELKQDDFGFGRDLSDNSDFRKDLIKSAMKKTVGK